MSSDFSSLRSTEDILNALSVLYFNLNEIERKFYDLFLNPEEKVVELQRYDDTGKLTLEAVKNMASYKLNALIGYGNPNGVVDANIGKIYIDLNTSSLYYKSSSSEKVGWVVAWSGENLVAGTDFLAPNGNGSQLTSLDMSHAGLGVLAVQRGGTGSEGITGLVKGNGSNPMTAAVDGVDYLGAGSMTGIIAYYPVATIPSGWLRCDGTPKKKATYTRLSNILGTTYGIPTVQEIRDAYPDLYPEGSADPVPSEWFNIPNLSNYFIRCWDGTRGFNVAQSGQVGVHNHPLTGNVGTDITVDNGVITNGHKHDKGDMDITGGMSHLILQSSSTFFHYWGAFYKTTAGNVSYRPSSISKVGDDIDNFAFQASRAWTGNTGSGTGHTHSLLGMSTSNNSTASESDTENRVLNKMLVPVIKY